MSAAPSAPSTTITRGDRITAVVETPNEKFIGQGKVHHVGAERFFVQLKSGRIAHNRYFNLIDEGKTWVRGWDPGWEPRA
jgi:hypothetical protein